MLRARPLYISALLFAALGFPLVAPHTGQPGLAYAESESLRPEVGKPLQAARDLMKAQKFKEALNKVREADNAANKTAYESYMVERMRGSAASGAGDMQLAAKSFETVLNSGRVSGAEKLSIMEALAGTYYRAKDYATATSWATRYQKEGGTNPQIIGLISQAKFLGGDYAGTARELQAGVQASEKAGKAPSEEHLQLLANCYLKLDDAKGYAYALEKLVTYYPKKSYWADVIAKVQRKPGFSERLTLDAYRLKFATGNMVSANDYMEMSQLAMQDGMNAEGKKIVDQGFAAGVLGVGKDADREKRLRDLVVKRLADDATVMAQAEKDAVAAKDGDGLIKLGMNYVGNGKFDKGISLMEQGIRMEKLKRPEDDKLRLGIAYLWAGQKDKASQMLKAVKGEDGTGDLARLWLLQVKQPAQ